MNIFQKIILAAGAIVLVAVLYIDPVKYTTPASRAFYDPQLRHNITVINRVDVGATSLRGIAVIGATAALWAIARKKKVD